MGGGGWKKERIDLNEVFGLELTDVDVMYMPCHKTVGTRFVL